MRIMAPIFFVLAISLAGCGRGSTGNPAITPLPTLDPARMNAGTVLGNRPSDERWAETNRIALNSDKDILEAIQKAVSKEELLQHKHSIEQSDLTVRLYIYEMNPAIDASRIKELESQRIRLNELYAQVQRRLAEF